VCHDIGSHAPVVKVAAKRGTMAASMKRLAQGRKGSSQESFLGMEWVGQVAVGGPRNFQTRDSSHKRCVKEFLHTLKISLFDLERNAASQ